MKRKIQDFFSPEQRSSFGRPATQRAARGWTGRSPLILLFLVLGCSLAMGWGGAMALDSHRSSVGLDLSQAASPTKSVPIGTVDPVTQKYQLGQELYLQNCSTCHIAIPPGVLPTEAWAKLLQQEEHYGTKVTPLTRPSILLVWQYLQHFSRRLTQREGESVPDRLQFSRYFKALHPNVKFTQPIEIGGCVTCHPGAAKFNFRTLTPEWENSP